MIVSTSITQDQLKAAKRAFMRCSIHIGQETSLGRCVGATVSGSDTEYPLRVFILFVKGDQLHEYNISAVLAAREWGFEGISDTGALS